MYDEQSTRSATLELSQVAGTTILYIKKFKGKNDDWYWALTADNGESIAIGGEGYTTERECNRAINRAKAALAGAEVRKNGVFGWIRDTDFYSASNALGLLGR